MNHLRVLLRVKVAFFFVSCQWVNAQSFNHGVASGDPFADSIVLWTRVTSNDDLPVEVKWQLSRSEDFSTIVTEGLVVTGAARDYTVKVIAGGLASDTHYYYRFSSRGLCVRCDLLFLPAQLSRSVILMHLPRRPRSGDMMP